MQIELTIVTTEYLCSTITRASVTNFGEIIYSAIVDRHSIEHTLAYIINEGELRLKQNACIMKNHWS